MLNRIPDYPPPARALDGSEPLAAWQDGKQRAVPILQIALVALDQIAKELDAGLSAYGSWLRLPGNAGKSVEQFLASLVGPEGKASGPLVDGAIEARHLTNDAAKLIAIRDKIGAGAPSISAGFVDGTSYPGTNILEDPARTENDNAKLDQAQKDVTDPTSANFGKMVVWPGVRGSGVRDPDEHSKWYAKLGATYADSLNPALILNGRRPIDPAFMTEDKDLTWDCWSQNGDVRSENPLEIVNKGLQPGNLDPRVHHLFLPGARVRKPKRAIIRPLMLCFDPNKTPATTKNGIDTQTAVKGGGSIRGLVTVGGVHYLGRNNHFNSVSLNGVGDYFIQMRGYGSRCDELYIGAGNVGDGTWNRHNIGITFDLWADGWNCNNRNSYSIVDGTRIRGTVYAINFGQKGGSGAVDTYNPDTGVSAPGGGGDIEPNGFTDDPWVRDIKIRIVCIRSGTAAVATLLLDNDTIPTPIRDIELHVVSRENYRGCHVCIGGTNMRTPYDIRVYPDSDHDYRPYELLSGQGVKHINGVYQRSFAAGLIGYVAGQAMQDLWFHNGRWQELGTGDSSGTEVRGWQGGGLTGDVVNCKVSGFKYINGSPIRDLTVDLRPKNIDEISTVNNCKMEFLHQVLTVDGGALINPGSINDIGRRPDIPNDGWEVNGAWVSAIPGAGLWKIDNEVRFLNAVPNAPSKARVVQTNTAGAPTFIQMDKIPGVLDPTFTGTIDPGMRVRNQPPGKITAIGPNAYLGGGGSGLNGSINGRAPFVGTRTVYIGMFSTPTPSSPSQLIFGIGFIISNAGFGAIAIVGGQPASTLRSYAYNDAWAISYSGGNPSSVSLRGTPIYSSNTNAVAGYLGAYIATAGEDFVITGY